MGFQLALIGLLLLGASAGVGIFLGWDKMPLAVTACGFAVAGGLSLLGSAIVEAARILRKREKPEHD